MLDSASLPILDSAAAAGAPGVATNAVAVKKSCKDAKRERFEPTRRAGKYWRSLDELADTQEFRDILHREFPEGASELFDETTVGKDSGFSRRRWMQLMGASVALASAGCQWETEKIVPMTYRPEGRKPGMPQFFATAWELDGVARPLVARQVDGRPVKLEGNSQHPFTNGGTDVYDQGVLLGMYDPDRLESLVERSANEDLVRTWNEVEEAVGRIREAAKEDSSKLRVLAEPTSSLLVKAIREKFAEEFPDAKWVTYSACGDANERAGLKAACGSAVRPVYDLSKADVVVSLDADPLGVQPGSHRYIRDWASRRTPESGEMNRTYAFESNFSGTGASADHRAGVRSSDIGAVVAALGGGSFGDGVVARVVKAAASDLAGAKGKSAVICGAHQPPAVHAAVAALNEKLGNVGKTVTYVPVDDESVGLDGLKELASDLEKGLADTLFVLGGNPIYDAPADLGLKAAFAGATVVRLGMYDDETARVSDWVLPQTHPMEEWNLLRTLDGTVTVCQPLIDVSVVGGRSAVELISMLAGEDRGPRELFDVALEAAGAGDEAAAKQAIHDGFVADSAAVGGSVSFATAGDVAAGGDGIEVVITPSFQVHDGRFSNNGWLQETPAPLTRLVWDNAACMSPATADELGVGQGELVSITANGATIEVPVFLMPGHAKNSIGLSLGYGREAAGLVGGEYYGYGDFKGRPEEAPAVGFNVNPLRSADQPSIVSGATVSGTGKQYRLATVQDHHAIDKTGLEGIAERIGELVREGTVENYEEHSDFAQHAGPHHPPLESLWDEPGFENRRWGMSIDLSKCVGCNACVTACTSENNIPVVGKDQVARGREMHWIRVDRYFAAPEGEDGGMDLDAVRAVHQPVACHHCETAPCEQVCPVAATVHSAEGLNDMVYNRCIGTRYCANNCPYKVRRFNFFNYNKRYENSEYDLQAMVLNPEVTVRARGVMEKCTYCVQRIKGVTQYARSERRPIEDGEIVTACQAACPADAIVFGDLSDSNSAVSKEHENPRAYAMLAELNVKPRTRYLARIRNPHPDLADLVPDMFDHEGHGGGHGDGHGDHGEVHGSDHASADHSSEHGGEHHDEAHGDHAHGEEEHGEEKHGEEKHGEEN